MTKLSAAMIVAALALFGAVETASALAEHSAYVPYSGHGDPGDLTRPAGPRISDPTVTGTIPSKRAVLVPYTGHGDPDGLTSTQQ